MNTLLQLKYLNHAKQEILHRQIVIGEKVTFKRVIEVAKKIAAEHHEFMTTINGVPDADEICRYVSCKIIDMDQLEGATILS